MSKLYEISCQLNSYHGRDTCLRFFQYFSLLIFGVLELLQTATEIKSKALIISAQLSNCRILTRFFDDLPAFFNLYNYYFKSKTTQHDVSNFIHIF